MIGRIHDRYLLRQFIKIVLISVLSFTLIYITVDTFEEIDNFIDHNAQMRCILQYYAYSIPFILTYIVPVSLLLGTIFSLGILARRNELTAFIASGVSLIRIAAPILITAIFVSIVSAFLNDIVVAKANRAAKDVKEHCIEGRARSNPLLKENFHYLGENGYIYLAARYNHQSKTLFDVVLQQFDRNTLIRRIDAKKASWNGQGWLFTAGYERSFTADGEQISAFEELIMMDLIETPANFLEEEIDRENMTFSELSSYVDKVRRSGGDVERYLTDLYFKFSYPLAGCIFVLIGIAFAAGKRKQSIATGFGLTLLISFVYYGVLRVGQTLGYNGVLPPFIAAEMGNIVFLIIGVGLIGKANQ